MTAENQNNNVYSPDTEQDVEGLRVYFCMWYVKGKMLRFDWRLSMNFSSNATNYQVHDARVRLPRDRFISTRKEPGAKNFSCCFKLINSRFEIKLVLLAEMQQFENFFIAF